jgi:hypothetical protein
MPGFRMPHQFLSFGAGDGLYGGSVFVWVNYESPFELNAANVTGCFLVFARSAPVLIVTLQLSLKEFLTRELLRSSRSARHFSVANWVSRCPLLVEFALATRKIALNGWNPTFLMPFIRGI